MMMDAKTMGRLAAIKAAKDALDAQPVPTKGRMVWPPEYAITDEQVREKFEAWVVGQFPTMPAAVILLLDESGSYDRMGVQSRWEGWQAAIREAIGRGERG